MTVDYDTPRITDNANDAALGELRLADAPQSSVVDIDEDLDRVFELPGADLSGEELTVRVIPVQVDEFTCRSCFLVHHRSQLAVEVPDRMICRDCAA